MKICRIRLQALISTFMSLFGLCLVQLVEAQTEEWVQRYIGPGNPGSNTDQAVKVITDDLGYVYVTGYSVGAGTREDYATIKYDSAGNRVWLARYDGAAHKNDFASALALDLSGNVYVTGSSVGTSSSDEFATIKYDSTGSQVWVARYPTSWAHAVAVDSIGNVYVTGHCYHIGTGTDYLTIKYDSEGNQIWDRRYNGPSGADDESHSIAVDSSGNVYVTGLSRGLGSGDDFATVKYGPEGNQVWERRYSGPGNGNDYASALAVDPSGNVYVTGTIIDSGNLSDYATIKYDPAGNQVWVSHYNGPNGTGDVANALAVDSTGNVYVTGSSSDTGSSYGYATVKYDSLGIQVWVRHYKGPGNYHIARTLALDLSGSVYVSGYSAGDYATVKYDPAGNQAWVARYSGTPNDTDDASSVAVDSSGNAYVTGYSYGTASGPDYATIKYSTPNIGPTAMDDGPYSVDEDGVLTITPPGVLANDNDPENNPLSANLVSGPAHAASFSLNSDGSFSYSPTANYYGPDSFTYQAFDGTSYSNTATVSLSVASVNDMPILTPIGNKATGEQTLLTFTASATDADLPANVLAYTLEGSPVGASIDASTGVFTWTPTEEQGPGDYTFTVRVTDNGDPALSDEETIIVHVVEANQPPVLNDPSNQTVDEGSLASTTLSATDADLPAQPLTYSLVSGPGAVVGNTWSWTPGETHGGITHTVTVQVSDGLATAQQSFEVTVNEVNQAPVLSAIGNRTVNEQTLLTFTALATDTDLPTQSLTFSLVGAPAGAAIHPTSGLFTWTPTEGQGPGAFTLKVRVTDSGTPSLFDEEEITVTVNEVNDPPVLGAIGNRTVDEMALMSITATATDPDLPGQVLTFSLGTAPAGASINPTTGVITWTPSEADGPNPFTFQVIVSDGTATDTESFVVTVAEVNRPPVLTPPGDQTLSETATLSLQLAATDPDIPANGLTFEKVSGPAALTVSPSGLVQWTPTNSDGPARVAVSVRVIDHGVPSLADTAVFHINVTDADIVEKSISGRVELLDFVGDLAQQPIAFEIRTVGEPGTVVFSRTVTLAADGSYSFVTSLGSVGTGLYDVAAKGSHWLRRVRSNVSISASGAAGVDFAGSAALINGDVDGDNEVGIGDYAMLSFAYGSIPGDANWLANADVNGDLAVDIADYAILSARYGLVGDE